MQIILKALDGTVVPLEVDPSWPVAQLRASLLSSHQDSIPVEHRLLFNGQELEDGDKTAKTLGDYKLEDRSVVYCIPKLIEQSAGEVFLDLVFVVDNTGSMGSYILETQKNIQRIVDEIIASERADVQFGLVIYRDFTDRSTLEVREFMSDLDEMQKVCQSMRAAGGGDIPEAVATGLNAVLDKDKFDFRPEATKVCVFITDAPPHGLEPGRTCPDNYPNGDKDCPDLLWIVRQLSQRGILLYSVGCEPTVLRFLPTVGFMKWAADECGGKYISLSNASLLSNVIIGGCREEINRDRLAKVVEAEILAINNESSLYNQTDAQIADRLWERLSSKSLSTVVLDFDGEPDDNPKFHFAALIRDSADLKEAKSKCGGNAPKQATNSAALKKEATCQTVPVTKAHVQAAVARLRKRQNNSQTSASASASAATSTCSVM